MFLIPGNRRLSFGLCHCDGRSGRMCTGAKGANFLPETNLTCSSNWPSFEKKSNGKMNYMNWRWKAAKLQSTAQIPAKKTSSPMNRMDPPYSDRALVNSSLPWWWVWLAIHRWRQGDSRNICVSRTSNVGYILYTCICTCICTCTCTCICTCICVYTRWCTFIYAFVRTRHPLKRKFNIDKMILKGVWSSNSG